MDKTLKYQQILNDILEEYGQIKKSLTPNVKHQTLIDATKKHFLLLSIGFYNQKFVYNPVFHFDIIDNKIWIQQNNTDVLIADELQERGVEKSDIVLGFVPPHAREFSGFAVA
jgi:hypothetical protein